MSTETYAYEYEFRSAFLYHELCQMLHLYRYDRPYEITGKLNPGGKNPVDLYKIHFIKDFHPGVTDDHYKVFCNSLAAIARILECKRYAFGTYDSYRCANALDVAAMTIPVALFPKDSRLELTARLLRERMTDFARKWRASARSGVITAANLLTPDQDTNRDAFIKEFVYHHIIKED